MRTAARGLTVLFLWTACLAAPSRAAAADLGGGPGNHATADSSRAERGRQHGPWRPPANGSESGLAFGTPAGLEFTVGNWRDRFAVRVTGMYLGELGGGEAAVLWSPFTNPREYAFGIALGTTHSGTHHYDYAGPVFEMRGRWWYEQIGLGYGHGSWHSPQALVQIGLLHSSP